MRLDWEVVAWTVSAAVGLPLALLLLRRAFEEWGYQRKAHPERGDLREAVTWELALWALVTYMQAVALAVGILVVLRSSHAGPVVRYMLLFQEVSILVGLVLTYRTQNWIAERARRRGRG